MSLPRRPCAAGPARPPRAPPRLAPASRAPAALAPVLLAPVLLTLALLSACSRAGDPAAAPRTPPPRTAPVDTERPLAALRLDPDAVAARLGSFAWKGEARWSATKGDRRLEVTEQHAVRQLATGEFDAEGTIDPGRGPGSESGKRVVWTGGMTYARSQYPASGAFRERPGDHGRAARRFRDESFLLAEEIAALLGPALVATPAGPGEALGRSGRRFRLSLDSARFTPGPSRASDDPPTAGLDPATRARLELLDGRAPVEASGELLLDGATGVPLLVRLSAVLAVKGDPHARVQVEVVGEVKAIGRDVASVERPANVLPDERRPRGVARALEQAGLRKKKGPGVAEAARPGGAGEAADGPAPAGDAEPADEEDE